MLWDEITHVIPLRNPTLQSSFVPFMDRGDLEITKNITREEITNQIQTMIHISVKFFGTIKHLYYLPFTIEQYNESKKPNVCNNSIVQLYGIRGT